MNELSQARRLLESIGPGRLLLVGPDTEALAIELRRLGCTVSHAGAPQVLAGDAAAPGAGYDAVLWSWKAGGSIPKPARLRAVAGEACGRMVLFREPGWTAPAATDIQRAAMSGGWRRSLCDWSVQHYRDLDHPGAWSELYLEPVPPASSGDPGPGALVDPTRATDPLADASLARHALAAEHARPGDHVVVLDCRSGAGASLIAQRSRCARVTGLDESEAALDYARRHHGMRDVVAFARGAASRMATVRDCSVDLIVAVEGLATGAEWAGTMAEFARVLKPDGRVVAAVAVGASAAPDAEAVLLESLASRLLVEARYLQPMPAAPRPTRAIDRIALDEKRTDAGWRVVIASADALRAAPAAFEHPEFRASAGVPVPVTDFAGWYDNPWLYRVMVQMGQRLQDEAVLTDFALAVLSASGDGSADAGAALCVLAYQVLGRRQAGLVAELLPLIDAYAARESDNPHVQRWQISLEFAGALACMTSGDLVRAEDYLERVTRRDPLAFSPLLSTKVVAAAFWLGIRRLVGRQPGAARACFEAGVQAAARALQAPIERSVGSLSRPNTFGFPELAEVADMASQCAQALDAIDCFDAAPGRFWRQVDTRRFGLATWLLHLERENRDLRRQLQDRAA